MSSLEIYEPSTVDEATAYLSRTEGTICLAGGGTLMAMMNANLVDPAGLVSLQGIDEMKGIEQLRWGKFRIGAFTQHRVTAAENRLIDSHSALKECAGSIASVAIRNKGTIGGSVALADPGADYPAALVALEAEIEVASPGGRRRKIPASEFFVNWYTTALAENEIITAIYLPSVVKKAVGFYEKFSRVEGDFATASAAGVIRLDRKGRCDYARIVIGCCGPTPTVSEEANALLVGSTLDDEILKQAGELIAEKCDPVDDVRGTAEYRRKLAPVLVARGIKRVLSKKGV